MQTFDEDIFATERKASMGDKSYELIDALSVPEISDVLSALGTLLKAVEDFAENADNLKRNYTDILDNFMYSLVDGDDYKTDRKVGDEFIITLSNISKTHVGFIHKKFNNVCASANFLLSKVSALESKGVQGFIELGSLRELIQETENMERMYKSRCPTPSEVSGSMDELVHLIIRLAHICRSYDDSVQTFPEGSSEMVMLSTLANNTFTVIQDTSSKFRRGLLSFSRILEQQKRKVSCQTIDAASELL